MKEFTPGCKALGKSAPFTGSAIYLEPNAAWHEGAWPLWTHIVRYIDGCMGCAGGQILESVELLNEPMGALLLAPIGSSSLSFSFADDSSLLLDEWSALSL